MQVTKRPVVLLFVIALLILSLFLKQDKTELGDLVLVSGMGVEQSNHALTLTAEIVVNERDPYTVRVIGKDLVDCMEKIGDALPGIPYWGGTVLLLLNETAAKNDTLLTEIYQSPGLNPGVLPVLSVGDAEMLLAAGFGDTGTSLGAAASLAQQEEKPITLMDLLRAAAEGETKTLPRLYLKDGKARLADGAK